MRPTVAFFLALLATHCGLQVNPEIGKDEVQQMREREEYLHQEMTRLLQEIEESNGTMEALLYSAWQQQRLLWVTAAALLLTLFAMRCWLLRRSKHGSASCREMQALPSIKELVDQLLGVCRELSRKSFMPELHRASRIYTSSEACSLQQCITHCLLVVLRPPLGHSFSLESIKQPPTGHMRVALECLCSGEQLPGQRCFLHTSYCRLPMDRDCYHLDSLCTGLCLDKQKVTDWVRTLVASAWRRLPYARHWQLTAVPSKRSCSFQLRGTSGLLYTIEMALTVQRGGSDAYLSFE